MTLFRSLTTALLCTNLSFSITYGMEKLPFEDEGNKGKKVSTFSQSVDQEYQETVLELKDAMTLIVSGQDRSEQIADILSKLTTLLTKHSHEQASNLYELLMQTFMGINTSDRPHGRHAGLVILLYFLDKEDVGFSLILEQISKGGEAIPTFINDILCNEGIIESFICQLSSHLIDESSPEEELAKTEKIILDSYVVNPFSIHHASEICPYIQFLIGSLYFRALHSNRLNNIDYSQFEQAVQVRNRVATYLGVALKYYIQAAKQGTNEAYKELLLVLKRRQAYEEYYKELIPLLEAEDRQAQDLFNRVALEDLMAFNFFDKLAVNIFQNDRENPLNNTFTRVIENHMRFLRSINPGSILGKNILVLEMETDRDNPAEQTPVVRTNSPSANEENLTPQEQFKKAMSCWNSAPEETLRLFFNILGNSKSSKNIVAQVNKKLAEIKKTNGYKHPKTIAQKDQYNNIGYLLYLGEKTKGPKPSSTKQELKSSKETKQHTPNTNNTSPSASSKKKKKHTPKAQPAESKENTPSQKLSQEVKVANPSSKKVEQKQAIEDRGPDLPQDVPQDLLRTEEKSPAAIEMATLSGEGSSLHSSPLAEVNVNNDLPKELRSTVSENKEPNAKEKGPKTNVGKTLEQKISPKKLPRRNSIDHLPIEPGLTAERPKLRRADTVKNLPTFASTADENHHPHKKPSSKKISLSNLLPRKERSSKKSQNILNEKDPITPKEKSKGKRLSVTTVDSSPSESEGEGKKTPRTKKSKKSSSSSRSSSMESSVRANNIEDSLISHNELPEKSLDYYPRHYRLLHQILTHKYKLDSDDQDTLAVILGERERSFEIDSHKIKRLFAQFETTKGSHHKRHEVIDGMGLTLNPNADGLKKGSYNAQLEQAKEKLITILAPTLTIADYEAAQKNSSSQNNTNH